ncbi:4Fe-4S dicluster domain-containing protein [Georgenia sp. SYP-B2076]|uniref:4Fe-4S dicluster domain-containing protein n=1 Tax=Georgenia sp. SYP-B2076 TaxID=2495881 RepID=UPI000F8E527F|nr:4Fe-4S dicluster domain-containing protein [Georgenia sp. SYP-B2076]
MSAGPGLRGVQGWLRHQPAALDLELVCAEHPSPSRGAAATTVIRLATCADELPLHELAELFTLGAARVRVRLDGCARADAARDHLAPVAAVLRAAGTDSLDVDGWDGSGGAASCVDGSGGEGTGGEGTGLDAGPHAVGDRAAGRRGPTRQPRARRRPVLEAAHMPVARRQLLGLGGRAPSDLPAQYLDPHERLVAAVRALVPAGAPGLAQLDGPAARLTAHGCAGCGVCVQACPADALRLRHGGDGGLAITTLLQAPAACDGCRRCLDLCPSDALASTGAWPWSQTLLDTEAPVATLTTARCERCRTRFPSTTGAPLCAVCDYRRRNPFGSTTAPGMQAPAPGLPTPAPGVRLGAGQRVLAR